MLPDILLQIEQNYRDVLFSILQDIFIKLIEYTNKY